MALVTNLIQCDSCHVIDDKPYMLERELDDTDWIIVRVRGAEGTYCSLDCLKSDLTNE